MALLTLAEATRAARVTGTPTADQTATLNAMIAALGGALEPVAGPIESEPRTWRIASLGADRLILPWRFQYVSAIVCDGVTLSDSTYDDELLAEAGVIVPAANGSAPWASATATVVTAVVGYAVVPANLLLAAQLLIQSWYETAWQSRGPASEAAVWAPPAGGLPPSVMQAVGADYAMPGFA